MSDLIESLRAVVGEHSLESGKSINVDFTHDEALTLIPIFPKAVLHPNSSAQVVEILKIASATKTPVTARGAGSGMCGACSPLENGIVVAFDRMSSILEIDLENQVAVVEPGVTLSQLNEALAPHGFFYAVQPGESSATIGGNVATNAGGMRAVRHGVTRNHILGIQAVLPNGDVINTGGKISKISTGYDLTQLLVGSEGTLALITKVTVKITPILRHSSTVLAPFATIDEIAGAVPKIITSGISPSILEYLDFLAMAGASSNAGLDLGISDEIKSKAMAYLLVVIESTDESRSDQDVEFTANLLDELGALDIYVLPASAALALIDAREKAFWAAKSAGANDVIDVVVPRSAMPIYLSKVAELAASDGALIAGCGHVGDGNVHLSVFQPDKTKLHALMLSILKTGTDLGGAISGEHGVGTEKLPFVKELVDPLIIELWRKIKLVFDPEGIMNPGHLIPD
ncbi:MAG: FAD-binding oxidoreductase [Acidimicrobiales bacterium]|nr:FAD-binding oxidoreductase [Acidimicrobiales bacterium]